MHESLDIENSILLACARSKTEIETTNRILQLIESDFSWDNLLKLAAHHRLLPLLHKHMTTICPDKVPKQAMLDLQQFYNYNKISNLQKITALIQIINLFEKHGIQVLSVKGPLFTHCYYGDIALRAYFDLDILVSLQDFDKACILLNSLGYNYFPENIPEQYFFKLAKLSHHGTMVNDAGVHVELHWELSGHYRDLLLTYEVMADYFVQTKILGYDLLNLKTEMLLVYLAVHGQQHYWQKYDYICCIAEVIKKNPDLNWKSLTHIADTLQVREVVFLALYLTKKLLIKELDCSIIENDPNFALYSHAVELDVENFRLINQAVIKHDGKVWKEIIPRSLKIIGSTFGLVSFKQRLRNYFIPQISDWEKLPLPYSLHYLYYLKRPIEIFSQKWLFRNNYTERLKDEIKTAGK